MAVSRISTMENSHRHITLAIDGYANRELQGRIYHDALDCPERFGNVMDMIIQMEYIFKTINYPAQAFNGRYFKKMEDSLGNRMRPCSELASQPIEGRLGTAKLYIKHRYNATWKGELYWGENREGEVFESFLELLCILDSKMEFQSQEELRRQPEYKFNGVMDLMRILQNQLAEQKRYVQDSAGDGYQMIPGQALKLCRSGEEQTTFLIRILFEENHTWQGTIQWKERGEQASFRSFLELVRLMDINLSEWNAWNNPQEWETEKYYWNYS